MSDLTPLEYVRECVLVTNSKLHVTFANPSAKVFFRLGDKPHSLKWPDIINPLLASDSPPLYDPKTFLNGLSEAHGSLDLFIDGSTKNVMYSVIEWNKGYLILIDDRTMVLKASDAYNRLITAIEGVDESIILTDVEGVIQYVNPAFEHTTGYSKDEAIGKKPSILKSGAHNNAFYEKMWNTLMSGQVWTGVIKNRRKDGTLYYDLASISPITNEHGEIANFISIKQDITERRNIEGKLKVSEKKNLAILKTVGEGVIVIDDNSRIKFVNHELMSIFGYSEPELIGKQVQKLMPEKYLTAHNDGMKRYMAGGAAKVLGTRVEVEGLRRDGSTFPIELRIEETRPENGSDRLFTAAIRDISQRKAMEAKLLKQSKELQELDSFKNKMLSIISHDLRSPLVSNIGLLNLMLDKLDDELSEKQRTMLSAINNSIKHQLKLVENLVDISMIHRGVMGVNLAPVSVGEILQESRSMLLQMAKDKGVEIIENYADDIFINVDKERMIQVLNNLVSNAIKFTKTGGKVTLYAKVSGDSAVLTVADTGIGIDPERIEKLFDMSEKTFTFGTDGERGTGLGLSICRELIQLNKGEISMESEEDKGSKVTLVFKVLE